MEKKLYITKKAYDKYIHTVKNNEDNSLEIARKKLTRNFFAGEIVKKDKRVNISQYGYLTIIVDIKRGLIIDVINSKKHFKNINENIVEFFNEYFNIEKMEDKVNE